MGTYDMAWALPYSMAWNQVFVNGDKIGKDQRVELPGHARVVIGGHRGLQPGTAS